jgi:RimJ/RimL family protein N-acetyltransferase
MQDRSTSPVGIRPWAEGDLPLLARLLGDPEMTLHIGGPESPEKLRHRHERYLREVAEGEGLFCIVVGPERTPAGWVGVWDSDWDDSTVWEVGWHVLPEFQGLGVATAGTELALKHTRTRGRHRFVHAFPSIDNAGSNGVCRKLGFELLGEVDVEYPPGHTMRSNNWRLDLLAEEPAP